MVDLCGVLTTSSLCCCMRLPSCFPSLLIALVCHIVELAFASRHKIVSCPCSICNISLKCRMYPIIGSEHWKYALTIWNPVVVVLSFAHIKCVLQRCSNLSALMSGYAMAIAAFISLSLGTFEKFFLYPRLFL